MLKHNFDQKQFAVDKKHFLVVEKNLVEKKILSGSGCDVEIFDAFEIDRHVSLQMIKKSTTHSKPLDKKWKVA